MKNVNKKKKKEDRVFSTGSAPSGGHEEGFPLPHEEGIKKKEKRSIVELNTSRSNCFSYGAESPVYLLRESRQNNNLYKLTLMQFDLSNFTAGMTCKTVATKRSWPHLCTSIQKPMSIHNPISCRSLVRWNEYKKIIYEVKAL